jgi:hypothetical protein
LINLPHFLMLWLAFLFFLSSKAQARLQFNSIQLGMGSTILLGDLGGSKNQGTHFIKDIDFQSSKFCISASADRPLSNHFEYRLGLKYLHLSASDKFSEELSRKSRNLSVKTNVIEVIPTLKFNLFGVSRQTQSNRLKNKFTHIYMTLGTGFIYFNPKAEFEGKTYPLKKLNTEGQGLPGGPKKYSNLALTIPLTIGIRKDFNTRWAMFFEMTTRKCFTDYLDDVSTNYYDQASLISAYGQNSANLADRNSENNKRLAGTKRGNPDKNDSYISIEFGIRKSLLN